jgi:uncharacterized protein
MPIITSSNYKAPYYLFNGHLETVVPSMFRKVRDLQYQRERLTTSDYDFLDLDWVIASAEKLVIISHGLEGSTDRHYVKGMAKIFFKAGYSVLAWNCRSCSGEINKTARLYHHGATEDLKEVISYAITKGYKEIKLVGFSMGGSMTLKYIGENSDNLPVQIKKGVVFSVPVNLYSSVIELEKAKNKYYKDRFLRKLEGKIKVKSKLFPEIVQYSGFKNIRDFPSFDNAYTAPLHGFKDAMDFYQKASAENFLKGIQVPVLLVNAQNDPFLPAPCYPFKKARKNKFLYLETPERGGHVGFTLAGSEETWAERRALEFCEGNN